MHESKAKGSKSPNLVARLGWFSRFAVRFFFLFNFCYYGNTNFQGILSDT